MPRKSAQPSVADAQAAPGGVAAVDRALSLLAAFRTGDAALTLTDLAVRTRLHKSTVLRLLASLRHARLVHQGTDGRYALGVEVARLSAIHDASFSLVAQVLPVLQELVDATQESAALHVRQGSQRLCLARVDSPHPLRDHLRTGDLLPLDRGTGGRVLLAFAGAPDRLSRRIRRDGVVVLSGDRVADLSGIAAPVWGAAGQLVGALTLSLPTQRLNPAFADVVKAAARRLSNRLGHQPTPG